MSTIQLEDIYEDEMSITHLENKNKVFKNCNRSKYFLEEKV